MKLILSFFYTFLMVFGLAISGQAQPQLQLIDLVEASELDNTISSTSSLVANTPMSTGVDGLGNANISIPIIVPPGVNGMTPSLALVYSSGSGDGVLGRNWSLAGMSSISRGNKQFFTDQELEVPNHQKTDPYYIDGQRLVHASGAYGQSYSKYIKRAEDNSFIQAKGTDASGPTWFQLRAAGGLTIDYGNDVDYNSDAVKFHPDGTKLVWAASRKSDCDGNYIDYIYDNSISTSNQLYLTDVNYGGNLGASTTHKYHVSISYAEHSYFPSVKYSNGLSVSVNEKVINRIEVFVGTQLIRGYNLYYAEKLGHLVLQKVQEFTPNGVLEPILLYNGLVPQITLNESLTNIQSSTTPFSSTPEQWAEIPGDFNNDGFTDFARFFVSSAYP